MPIGGKIKQIRCTNCSKRLFDGYITNGHVEIKCGCGTMNTVIASTEIKPERQGYQNRMELIAKNASV